MVQTEEYCGKIKGKRKYMLNIIALIMIVKHHYGGSYMPEKIEDLLAELAGKKNIYTSIKGQIPAHYLEKQELQFDINYAHNSTAIEGNTLSLMETKVLLEDKISIGGKDLREIFEVVNHQKAFIYVKDCIQKGLALDEKILKDIHYLLTENIFPGGIYRDHAVKISGASFQPPDEYTFYQEMQNFYADFNWRKAQNPIEYAAWTHAEFVRIHPFADGNGRTARMIMNYQLMHAGYLPIVIEKDERLAYYQALDAYGSNGDINPFFMLVARLENNQLDEYLALGKSLKLVNDFDIKLAIATAKDNDKKVLDEPGIVKDER